MKKSGKVIYKNGILHNVKHHNCSNLSMQFTTYKCAMKKWILNIAFLYTICNTQLKYMRAPTILQYMYRIKT